MVIQIFLLQHHMISSLQALLVTCRYCWLLAVLLAPCRYCWLLAGIAGSLQVLLAPCRYCWLLAGIAGSLQYCWFLAGIAGSLRVLLAPCRYCWLLAGIAGSLQLLLCLWCRKILLLPSHSMQARPISELLDTYTDTHYYTLVAGFCQNLSIKHLRVQFSSV